jgi:glutamate dehydrogenase
MVTLRTNYFQPGADGRPKGYLSFKLDSAKVPDLPLPRPMYEVFVYSPRMEGVHLRGGKVARGGIRWSDRREDFRTEVLGLMKAQTVKNAVIVPVGAKGGFVVKQPARATRRCWPRVVACYRTSRAGCSTSPTTSSTARSSRRRRRPIRRRRPLPRRRCRQGHRDVQRHRQRHRASTTASGSVTRSPRAARRLRPQGDGHHGPRRLGVGQRHFRELGVDVQSDDFTCVGIGDMSGDVFGNGMLLSEHIRLSRRSTTGTSSWTPTPTRPSFRERQRLFDVPRSSWADYDQADLRRWRRLPADAKSMPLSPEVRAALGVEERCSPRPS